MWAVPTRPGVATRSCYKSENFVCRVESFSVMAQSFSVMAQFFSVMAQCVIAIAEYLDVTIQSFCLPILHWYFVV